MANDIATEADNSPAKKFQEKIAAKIRADIGKLMPDDMLQQIVKDAIHAELYRDTRAYGDQRYGEPKVWIREAVRDAMKDSLKTAVQDELQANGQIYRQELTKQLREQLPAIMGEVLLAIVRGQGMYIENIVENFIRNNRI